MTSMNSKSTINKNKNSSDSNNRTSPKEDAVNYQALDAILSILDPPVTGVANEETSLTISHVMKSYDNLLVLFSSYSSLSFLSEKREKGEIDKEAESVSNMCENSDIIEKMGKNKKVHFADQKGEDVVSQQHLLQRLSYWSDLCRALLLSSHLLIEMMLTLEEEEEEERQKQQLSHNGSECIQSQKRTRMVLKRTIRRCTLLLKGLSFTHRQYFVQSADSGLEVEKDWHDVYLPQSRYQLLQECFRQEERLVPLDIIDDGNDCNYETLEENHTFDGTTPTGENTKTNLNHDEDKCSNTETTNHKNNNGAFDDVVTTKGERKNGDNDENDGDDEDIIDLNLDPHKLQQEEEELLNIAMPPPPTDFATSSNKKRKKDCHDTKNNKCKKNKKHSKKSKKKKDEMNTAQWYNDKLDHEAAERNDTSSEKNTSHYDEFTILHSASSSRAKMAAAAATTTTTVDLSNNRLRMASMITREGHLIYVDENDTKRQKCHVRLFSCGILVIEIPSSLLQQQQQQRGSLEEKQKEEKCHYYCYALKHESTCKPILYKPKGDTTGNDNDIGRYDKIFHFQLEDVHCLNWNHCKENSSSDGADEILLLQQKHFLRDMDVPFSPSLSSPSSLPLKLLFSVDETVGGGLMEGYHWVNALTKAVSFLSMTKDHSMKMKKEWGEETWNESVDAVMTNGKK